MRQHRRWLEILGTVGVLAALAATLLARGAWVAHGAARSGAGVSHLATSPRPGTASPVTCTQPGKWTVYPSPNLNPQTDNNWLNGVATLSPTDTWAVGYDGINNYGQPIAVHWNGIQWSMANPSNSYPDMVLNAISGDSPNDVWSVGQFNPIKEDPSFYPAAAHWDGFAWTTLTTLPSTAFGSDDLYGVATISPSNAWAVGTGGDLPLIEQWDGNSWNIVATPSVSYYSQLNGVAAVSSNDIWAVGALYNTAGTSSYFTLIEHWNGTTWTVIPSPNPGASNDILYGVAAIATNNVWAVGEYSPNAQGRSSPLILHWNGTSWSVVAGSSSPNLTGLSSLAVLSPTDIWALDGLYAERWNGTTWTLSTLAYGSTSYREPAAIAPDGSGGVWAAGTDNATTPTTTMIERERPLIVGHSGSQRTPSRQPSSAILCP